MHSRLDRSWEGESKGSEPPFFFFSLRRGEGWGIFNLELFFFLKYRSRLPFLITWLILPVVICLFQRLSHACLSISAYTAKLRMAHYISYSLFDDVAMITWIPVVILELIHARTPDLRGRAALIGYQNQHGGSPRRLCLWFMITHRIADLVLAIGSIKFLPYQPLMVVYWTTMAFTGNGELGFDSGEGAWETATTSKEGSRRANYPIPIRGGSDKK